MTYEEVAQMIESIGLPFAYNEFPSGTEQAPPFVCFLYSASNDMFADNANFLKIRQMTLELYTDNKDWALEETVEDVLASHGLTFRRTETYIDSERMYQITFDVELLITEENNG